jgi:DNA polymerase V
MNPQPITNYTKLLVPLMLCTVTAGFPSPATDYIENNIDLNDYLVKHPSATFMVRAVGESMTGAFIPSKALLIIDRSLTAKHNDIILAAVNGDFTVKRLIKKGEDMWLYPANEKYKPQKIETGIEFMVWGVVTSIIINPADVK